MAQPEPIITVDQLVKTYDGKNVVDNVSFKIWTGKIINGEEAEKLGFVTYAVVPHSSTYAHRMYVC